MPDATSILTDIPDDQVDVVEAIANASAPPPTKVTRTRQPNGLCTITATFSAPTAAMAAAAATGAATAASGSASAAAAAGSRGRFAIDTFSPSDPGTLHMATMVLGIAPVFWGRYLYAPGQMNSSGHRDPGHYSTAENVLLRMNHIRVLPIARQTGNIAFRKVRDLGLLALLGGPELASGV